MDIQLDSSERAELAKEIAGEGGFQSLMRSLRQRSAIKGKLTLSPDDRAKIPRYAFDYGNGGFESRLRAIFERHLGPGLGRK